MPPVSEPFFMVMAAIIADAAQQHLNPHLKAQMSNEFCKMRHI
jgi:hypothetical protein